jgi:hypothetical protein
MLSKPYPLHLLLRKALLRPIVELSGPRTFVCSHFLRVFEHAAIAEIGGDAGRAEAVIADRRVNAGRLRSPTDHPPSVRLSHRCERAGRYNLDTLAHFEALAEAKANVGRRVNWTAALRARVPQPRAGGVIRTETLRRTYIPRSRRRSAYRPRRKPAPRLIRPTRSSADRYEHYRRRHCHHRRRRAASAWIVCSDSCRSRAASASRVSTRASALILAASA